MRSTQEDQNAFMRTKKFGAISESYASTMGKSWLPIGENGIKEVRIKELPVLYTKDGTVVCIPKLPEMGLIAAIGLTGSGKTLLAGQMIDQIFYNWGDNISVLNDSQEETWPWSEPQDNPEFAFISKKIRQGPMPLPMIYLLPNSENLDKRESIMKDKNYTLISIPFEEVINNIDKYIPNLGLSKKYLIAKKDELLEVTSEDELMDIIESINPDGKTKGMAEVVAKVRASFEMLIREGILSISNKSVPSYLTTKKNGEIIYSGNPFSAVMCAECIPSFITSDLYTQSYKDAIFSYYLDNLFDDCKKERFANKRTWLYFDELTKVVHTDPKYTSPETEKALVNIASRGRNNGISLIYATQGYNEIPKGIRSQTKFAIVFRHKSDEQSEMITKDFALDKTTREEIKRLKKYEAIICTTENVVCYKNDKRWETPGPIKGMIFPCLHKNKFLSLTK